MVVYTDSLLNILINNNFIPSSHKDLTKFFNNIKEDASLIESDQRRAIDILVAKGGAAFLIWYIPIVSFFILLMQFICDDPPNEWPVKAFSVVTAAVIAAFAKGIATLGTKSRIFIHSHYLVTRRSKFLNWKYQTQNKRYSKKFIRYLEKEHKARKRWGSRETQLIIRKRLRIILAALVIIIILLLYIGLFDYLFTLLINRLQTIQPDIPGLT